MVIVHKRNAMTTTLVTFAAVLLMAGPLAAQQTKSTTSPKTTATAGTGNTLEQNSAINMNDAVSSGSTGTTRSKQSNMNANGTKANSAPNATLEQNSAANAPSGNMPAKTDASSSTTTTGKGVKARKTRDRLVNLKPNDPKK